MQVVDDFAPIGLINAARATWPAATWEHWHRYAGEHGDKFASKDAARLPAACQLLIARMVEVVSDDSWPDLSLHGAGMHWIPKGGRLPLHYDAATHPLTGWQRRWNAVLYLDHCDGGELVFRDGVLDEIDRVIPQVNRLAVFATDKSHEVLPVIDGDRRSLSLFWWGAATSAGHCSAEWVA